MFAGLLPMIRRVQVSFLLFIFSNLIHAQKPQSVRPWKGYALLGNGQLCAVYSDDPRTNRKGIQYLYHTNYNCSYIGRTDCNLFDPSSNTLLQPIKRDSVGMVNFFTTSSLSYYENEIVKEVNCYAHPDEAIILSVGVDSPGRNVLQKTEIYLHKIIKTDRITSLESVRIEDGKAIAEWTNHTFLIIGCNNALQSITVNDSVVIVSGRIISGKKIEIAISCSSTAETGKKTMGRVLSVKNPDITAASYWNDWMHLGIVPKFSARGEKQYIDYFKRNLYCAKAVCMGGFIPADITGFFTTNNMPQLYPRDAMMCARAFLLTGHLEEAKEIITFWTDKRIPMKSKGEWFARYDAYSKAVDAGSGARFDEPEWDANGYFIQLLNMYHQKTNKWLADTAFIYQLADFLVGKIDQNGLLYEGGIIELRGYLPATNMTCAAALKTASEIAYLFGDQKRRLVYKGASARIATSLPKMFDKLNNTYADVRYSGKKNPKNDSVAEMKADTLFLWNTTMNFGVLWGFPNHKEVGLTNAYYQKKSVKKNGGVQYFTSPDEWLDGYGSCMFFFSTAARAQYMTLYGDPAIAKSHIDWMIRNVNSYGLMPERIPVDDSDQTPASPLSWCSAEFSEAVLLYGLTR